MKIESYSYVFSGLDPEPYYAAAADFRTVWAAASGKENGGALTVVQALEGLDQMGFPLKNNDVEESFRMLHLALKQMNTSVSAAGVFSDGKNMNMFSLGNARVFMFDHGCMKMHTDDDSEAYQAFLAKGIKSAAAYDEIRFQQNHLLLRQALGGNGDGRPHFYAPIPLQNDIAFLICTEPFWRFINVMEMELDFLKSAGPKEWLQYMIRRVMMKSDQRLDHENFAAAALMIEEE